jgi:hypothetical protein
MACDDPINETTHIGTFNLKADTPYDPTTQMLQQATKVPVDLTGYTFESRFLDKDPDVEPKGATILDEAVVTITGDPVNGIYAELLTESEVAALLALAVPPTFWEFFATKAGVRHKWFTSDVGQELAGSPP